MGLAVAGGTDRVVFLKSGTISGTGRQAIVEAFGLFNCRLGTFTGSIQLERSFDAGSNWEVVSIVPGTSDAIFTNGPVNFQAQEPEIGVLYAFNCTLLSTGTPTWRISK